MASLMCSCADKSTTIFLPFCTKSIFCPAGMEKYAFKRQLMFLSDSFKFIVTEKCYIHKKVSNCWNTIAPFTYVITQTFGK